MKIQKRKDGHVHSPFCPHGTEDTLDMYVKEAIKNNMEEMTFTEHMPYSDVFCDKDFLDECCMSREQTKLYIESVLKIKQQYKDKIKINLGFEVDYVDGLEMGTKEMLNEYGKYIEDSILSVHFVKYNNKYYAIDYEKDFKELLLVLNSIDKVYDLYFETLLKAIKSDLGKYKPKRIGHPTLVRIFNLLYPNEYKNYKLIEEIVKEIKNNNYEIDVNTAGIRKPYCKEIYPSGIFKEMIEKYNVTCIYGSDSHKAEDVCKDFIF